MSTSKKDIFEIFRDRLRSQMEENGVTGADVAASIGVGASMVSQILTGKKRATLETVYGTATRFHVSMDYLVGLTDDPTLPGKIDRK